MYCILGVHRLRDTVVVTICELTQGLNRKQLSAHRLLVATGDKARSALHFACHGREFLHDSLCTIKYFIVCSSRGLLSCE
jgi:hypothetical protein